MSSLVPVSKLVDFEALNHIATKMHGNYLLLGEFLTLETLGGMGELRSAAVIANHWLRALLKDHPELAGYTVDFQIGQERLSPGNLSFILTFGEIVENPEGGHYHPLQLVVYVDLYEPEHWKAFDENNKAAVAGWVGLENPERGQLPSKSFRVMDLRAPVDDGFNTRRTFVPAAIVNELMERHEALSALHNAPHYAHEADSDGVPIHVMGFSSVQNTMVSSKIAMVRVHLELGNAYLFTEHTNS